MWMTDYNDHGGELNLHDSSFNGTTRRLRPLIPRPFPSSTTLNSQSSNPPCFFAQYQHLGNWGEQSKREFINSNNTSSNNNAATTPQVAVSSRWNPTPEQLRTLEDLYRRGTRTPSAEQIQHITAQLRRYGKIEGKNVFYWFQNHKARERQKRRRQMESGATDGIDVAERNKELGSSRTVCEVEQTKNWPPSSNCSTTLAEEFHVSIQRPVLETNNNNIKYKVAAELSAMQVRTDGCIQLGDMDLHNTWNINNKMNGFVERNATWQMMQLSCPSPHLLNHLINTSTSTTTTSTITTTATNNTTDHINISNNNTKTASTMDQISLVNSSNITQQDHLSMFITPRYNRSDHIHHQNGLVINSCDSSQIIEDHQDDDDDYIHDNICSSSTQSQTLQLFPLRSGGDFLNDKEAVPGANASTPCQFFEFLPLKN